MAAGLVAKRGYSNIMVFRDGIPGWVKAGYPLNIERALPKIEVPSLNASTLKTMLDAVYIIDIRTENLYAMGGIKGCVRIPLVHLSTRYAEVPKGKKS